MDNESFKKHDELEEFLSDLSASVAVKAMDIQLKLKNGINEIEQKYKELQTDRTDRTDLEELLVRQIDALKGKIQCQDLLIDALKFKIDTYETANQLSKIQESYSDAANAIDEKMIEYQSNKIDKYKKGPKKKSLKSQQKWMLANVYFKEEISNHRTLKAARLVAAKRAGIFVEVRQLTKMMPDPR
jgi:hypothetical protein